MESKAVAKFVRITPRKVRVVLDLIRGKNVAEAFAILKFTPKAGAVVVEKVLRSAVANAENNYDMDVDKLVIKTAFADDGPTMKRIQKVNPHGIRLGIVKTWDAKWYADKDFADNLHEDIKIRDYLKQSLQAAGVSRVETERSKNRLKITIHTAKPGMVIGRGGSGIEQIKEGLKKYTEKKVDINIAEIKQPDMDATLVAENIAQQLERRIAFRRAMKQAVGRTMRLGAKGIKVALSGRLGGAEIARKEAYREGSIPLHTLRADIDYGTAEAHTTYGRIGVKVWIFKGEVLPERKQRQAVAEGSEA